MARGRMTSGSSVLMGMFEVFVLLFGALSAKLRSRADLVAEAVRGQDPRARSIALLA